MVLSSSAAFGACMRFAFICSMISPLSHRRFPELHFLRKRTDEGASLAYMATVYARKGFRLIFRKRTDEGVEKFSVINLSFHFM